MIENLKKLEKIFDILDIDNKIIVANYDNYDTFIESIDIEVPEIYKLVIKFLKDKKELIIKDLKEGKFVKVKSSISFYTLFIPSSNKEEFYVATPYLENFVSIEDYQKILTDQGVIINEEIVNYLTYANVINRKKFNYLLEFIFGEDAIDFDKIALYEDSGVKVVKKIFFERQYVIKEMLEKKSKFNKELKEAILNGDITKIMMIFDLEYKSSKLLFKNNLSDNKNRELGYYINDVLHFLFSDSCANKLDVNRLWVKVKNKLDNYDFSEDIIKEYCLLIDRERYKDKQQVVRNCIFYINNHIREKINLNDISASLEVNKSYLSSIFNKEMGFSIVDYIHDRRISNSKYLLANTDFSISEISDYIGYFDTSYYIRIFKSLTNMTPLKFREGFSED